MPLVSPLRTCLTQKPPCSWKWLLYSHLSYLALTSKLNSSEVLWGCLGIQLSW